ncbi:NAD(P)-binding protein [Thozetella sp. PMI_491]|nr:NAD(P)-binding protein [Thozetella sp. PMI_491]
MPKIIVVLGITGNQGASVADVFLKESDWKVRGISRDITKKSSIFWQGKGVEMVQGDVDNPESIETAFHGASAIFAVTDFWSPMYDQYNYGKLRRGQSINEYCYELELKRGINIARAASDVSTLDRFIFSSLPNIQQITKGKYRHVYHFDAKANIMAYIKDFLPALHAKTSELQLGEFATNWEVWRLRRPNKQEDGSYTFLVPGSPSAKFSIVVPRKDTGHFVRALTLLPPRKTLLGYGSILNHIEYAQIWTSIMGVKNGGVKEVTIEEAAEYEGGPHGLELAETMGSVLELDFENLDALHPHQIPEDIGCQTTSIEDYIKGVDYSLLLELD